MRVQLSAVLLLITQSVGSSTGSSDADCFCREVTGNEGSYCKHDHSPPNCHGSDIYCGPDDIRSHRTRGTRHISSAMGFADQSSGRNPWDSITMREQDAFCSTRTRGSYCKITAVSATCHISNIDCSKRTVFLALSPGTTSTQPTTRSTTSTSTTTTTTTTRSPSRTSTSTPGRPSTPSITTVRVAPPTTSSTTTTPTTTTTTTTTPSGPDPCLFTDARLIGRSPTSGDSYYMPLSSLRACMSNTKISHANAIWTLHNLHYGVAESYSFTDLVKNTLASTQTNACNHRVHPMNVDLVGEIKSQLREYKTLFATMTKNETDAYLVRERPAYEFHKRLLVLMNKLHDAHTLYSTPYTMFRVYSPINFGSIFDARNGQQKITIRASFDTNDPLGRLQSVYTRLFGSFPIGRDKIGATITHINGMSAVDFIKFLTSDDGLLAAQYQQQEQRMNAYIFSTPLLVFGQVLSYLPDFDSLSLTFEDGSRAEFRLMGQFADLSTSPYYSVPNLRSSASLSAYLHSNEAFNVFITHEENVDVRKPSMWKSVSAAAASHQNHFRRFLAATSALARMRLLSKRHKALLDPITNLKRDNILNIPVEEDDGIMEDGMAAAPRAPFVDAPTLSRVIKDALNARTSSEEVEDPTMSSSSSTTHAPVSQVVQSGLGDFLTNLAGSVFGAATTRTTTTAAPIAPLTFTTDNAMSYAISGDTIIVKIPTFAMDPPASGGDDFYYFPEFVRIQNIAKSSNIRRVLFDLTDNGGGYVVSAYAMLWYMMSDQSRICAPLHKRLTPSWQSWINSFGDGVPTIVSRYLNPLGDNLADRIDSIFAEVSSIVNVVFDGLSLPSNYIGSLTKATVLGRVTAAKARIVAMSNKRDRANAIRTYLSNMEYIPDDLPGKIYLIPEGGLAPFDPNELIVPDSRGRVFNPRMSNYRNSIRKNWGPSGTIVSQLGEFNFCYDTLMYMPTVGAGYDRNWFTQVGLVTDGTCGSACSLFSTLLTTNGDAVAFSYGGQANTAMDISSFCGGNVLEYDDVLHATALSKRIASLSSQRLSDYDRSRNETFVDSFMPMPTKATSRMNWYMAMMETHMSAAPDGSHGEDYSFDPLPRQMYIVPARKHINKWAYDDTGRTSVYADIIALNSWGGIVPQFSSTHGICPREASPFTRRTSTRLR